jgi:hypothetical protein
VNGVVVLWAALWAAVILVWLPFYVEFCVRDDVRAGLPEHPGATMYAREVRQVQT